jgi:hypothetical protein
MDDLRIFGEEIYFNNFRLGCRPAGMPENAWAGVKHVVETAPSVGDDAFDLQKFMGKMWAFGLRLKRIDVPKDSEYVVTWVNRDETFMHTKHGSIFLVEALKTSGDQAVSAYESSKRKDCF